MTSKNEYANLSRSQMWDEIKSLRAALASEAAANTPIPVATMIPEPNKWERKKAILAQAQTLHINATSQEEHKLISQACYNMMKAIG